MLQCGSSLLESPAVLCQELTLECLNHGGRLAGPWGKGQAVRAVFIGRMEAAALYQLEVGNVLTDTTVSLGNTQWTSACAGVATWLPLLPTEQTSVISVFPPVSSLFKSLSLFMDFLTSPTNCLVKIDLPCHWTVHLLLPRAHIHDLRNSAFGHNAREGGDGQYVLTRKAVTTSGEIIAVLTSFIKRYLSLLLSLYSSPLPQ